MTLIPPIEDTIALLFDTDPSNLPDGDILTLVRELRRRRSVFRAEEAAKLLAPKKERAVKVARTPSDAAKMDKPLSEIDLDDL